MFKEILYYYQHKDQLLKNYYNRYLLIKDEKIIGHFDSWPEAYLAAYRLFQNNNFFIKHCL